MHIVILGAGGFIGQKLARRLASDGELVGEQVQSLTLFDLAAPPVPPNAPMPVTALAGDIAALPANAIPPNTTHIFHLAAVVSSAAEADYDLGQRINIEGTQQVIAACRRLPSPPRVVFASSCASFAGGQHAKLDDSARQLPEGSYGAQKAIAELLLADASRKRFLDAVCLRLPTIVVRPGKPNAAASSFVSAIIREPLLGLETPLPVADDFAVWIASPASAVGWMLHAATHDTASLGVDRAFVPPGIRVTVGEMLAALDEAKQGASRLVHRVNDPAIAAIVNTWPAEFTAARARGLGYLPNETLAAMVQAFIAEDLAETRAGRGLG